MDGSFFQNRLTGSIFISLDDSTECQTGSKKEEQNDKEKKDEEETPLPTYRAKSIVESWVWGKQPGIMNVSVILLMALSTLH